MRMHLTLGNMVSFLCMLSCTFNSLYAMETDMSLSYNWCSIPLGSIWIYMYLLHWEEEPFQWKKKEQSMGEILQSSRGWLRGQHSGPISWGKTFGIHPKQQNHSEAMQVSGKTETVAESRLWLTATGNYSRCLLTTRGSRYGARSRQIESWKLNINSKVLRK